MVWSNKGTVCYNKYVKKLVDLFSTENEEKLYVVERSVKERMFRYFIVNKCRRYIDVLSDMVSQYNNTKQSPIKMTPVNASRSENNYRSYMNLNSYSLQNNSPIPKPEFAVSDKVCITKKPEVFGKVIYFFGLKKYSLCRPYNTLIQ